jgi:alginate O-acetyltransferase complex protein AlgI
MSLLHDQFRRPVATAAAPPTPAAGATAAAAVAAPAAAPAVDPRIQHTTPNPAKYVALAGQLGLLLAVFSLFNLESAGFGRLLGGIFAAFLVHYWLPFRWKEPFWVAASLAGSFWLLDAKSALLLIAAGLGFFLILRSTIALRWRILSVAAVFAALAYFRVGKALPIPAAFYPVFGAIFMFRMMIYAYDVAHSRERPQLLPFLSYFFLLPNYYFTLFPVIDFQTMRRSYFQRDIHKIAQQGIHWMARGAVQLALYRLVVYFNDAYLPDRVTTFHALVATMVLTYLAYLNVVGQFHLIVGLLHLFGYDLPETNRRYLLASSLADFWRRANIYWKDFMVKIVYFPVYFRLRKSGDLRAQIVATVAVFVITWALHIYQSFWLIGQSTMSWQDTIFWIMLGSMVLVNLLDERRRKPRRRLPPWQARSLHAVKVAGTFTFVVTVWSMWSSPSLNSWFYLISHWTQVK